MPDRDNKTTVLKRHHKTVESRRSGQGSKNRSDGYKKLLEKENIKQFPTNVATVNSNRGKTITRTVTRRVPQNTNAPAPTKKRSSIQKEGKVKNIPKQSVKKINSANKINNKPNNIIKINSINKTENINKIREHNYINQTDKRSKLLTKTNTNSIFKRDKGRTKGHNQNTSYINTRRKKRHNQRNSRIFSIALFVMIVVYLGGYTFKFVTKEKISFDTIQYGSIDTAKLAEGVIIRDETVYAASRDGVVSYAVADNQRVKKGSVVCSIKDEAVVSSMEENLEDINKNILKLQGSRDEMSLFAEDVKRMNNQIKSIIDDRASGFVELNISDIYSFKDEIQNKIDIRNQILLSENKGSLQDLANQKAEQENKISENISNIVANAGGIVSYYTDSMEAAYTYETMVNLTKEQTLMKPETINDLVGEVSNGQPVFKIVNTNDWYISTYIPNNYIQSWEEGDIVNIYIIENEGEDKEVEVSIEKLNAFEKESYVILKATKDILEYINDRNINFRIEKSKVGYKIANSSIIEQTLIKIPSSFVKDNIVHRVSEKGVEYVGITISSTNAEENIIYTPIDFQTVNVGDVIQNPENPEETYTLSEVENTKGVFIINTGMAEFYKINMENAVSNSTHTIIDPKHNTNINIYDRIVTDTKNIEKKQQVY